MSADKVVQKIVITPDAGETQDSAEPINAFITDEQGDRVLTYHDLESFPRLHADNRTITDTYGELSVKVSLKPGHKNITTDYDGLSVIAATLPSDFALPEDAGTTVTPEQFNKLLHSVSELVYGLEGLGVIEFSKG